MEDRNPPNPLPTGTAAPPKNFKTRAGIQRKTKEEREQFAREEALRNEKRLHTAPDPQAGVKGPPGARKPKTTGPPPGRPGSDVAGGVFGAAVPAGPKVKGRKSAAATAAAAAVERTEVEELGNGGVASASVSTSAQGPLAADGGDEKPKKKATTRKKAEKPKKGDITDVGSDESGYEEPRRDIETIWISSEDEIITTRKDKGKQVARKPLRLGGGLRPVRAPRNARDLQDVAVSNRNQLVKGIERDGDTLGHGIVIIDEMDVDPKDDPLTSPELRPRTGKRRSGRAKEVRVAETIEEKAERLRVEDETIRLRDELSHQPPIWSMKTTEDNDDDGMHMEDDPRNGRGYYLFQFPPYTPYLDEATPHIEIKDEPDVDLAVLTSSTNIAAQPPPGLKIEDNQDTNPPALAPKPDLLTASDSHRLPTGLAGKMRVHKSGRVSLDWGDSSVATAMEVRPGTDVDFLQDVVLLSAAAAGGQEDEDNEDDKSDKGMLWALGQVKRKMVVTPDWGRIYD